MATSVASERVVCDRVIGSCIDRPRERKGDAGREQWGWYTLHPDNPQVLDVICETHLPLLTIIILTQFLHYVLLLVLFSLKIINRYRTPPFLPYLTVAEYSHHGEHHSCHIGGSHGIVEGEKRRHDHCDSLKLITINQGGFFFRSHLILTCLYFGTDEILSLQKLFMSVLGTSFFAEYTLHKCNVM